MLDVKGLCGLLAGIISIFAFAFYNLSILRGITKPNRATWWILTLVGMIIVVSYYAEGARRTMWVPVTYIIGPFIVALLAIPYGVGGWTIFDRACLSGAGLSLVIWFLTGSVLIVLLMNLLMDFFGIMPTILKSYLRPKEEDVTAWVLSTIASVFNLLAVERWEFAIAVYPVYMLIGNGIITLLLFLSPRVSYRSNILNQPAKQ